MKPPLKASAVNGWLWLLLAGMFEIGFTTFLKLQQQEPLYGAAFLISAALSFQCLSLALRSLPLSLAYALWTGMGAVGTVVVGAALFGEALSATRLVLLALLIAVLIGLKLAAPGKAPTSGP